MEKFLLYCTKRHLRIISLDADTEIDLTLPISNLRTVHSVDYDPVDKMIYWTDIAKSNYGIIKRARLDGTGKSFHGFVIILQIFNLHIILLCT